jgi:hypothetical protein
MSCGQTVRRIGLRFEAKDVPFIQTSGSENLIRKFNHLPPILRLKWGGGMEKCGSKALMLEFLDRCGRNLDHCVAPT